MAKFCTNCGNPLRGNEKFCTKCGHNLSASANRNDAPPRVYPQAEADPQHRNYGAPITDYPAEPVSAGKKYIYIGVIAAVIVIAVIVAVFVMKSDTSSDKALGVDTEVVEDTIAATPSSAAGEMQESPRVYHDINSLMRYVGSNPSGYSIRKMGKDWNWKTGGSKRDALVFGEGYLGLSAVRIVGYVTPDGYLYGRYYGSNGIQLDVNGFIDENCELRIQLGHGSEASYMRLIEDADFDEVYHGVWGKNQKHLDLVFDYQNPDFSEAPADFSNLDEDALSGRGVEPGDYSNYNIEIEEYRDKNVNN